ncbi:MAG: flagellar basal body P-ring formation protein FlgA [Bradyrhizobium sp.]|nr:flagellar basal body P-ring formation protein FlgA [Bradyrhizobium sp.]
MMPLRPLLLAAALIAALPAPAFAGSPEAAPDWTSDTPPAIALPVLRAAVTVTGDVVRIGDVIDNAGTFSQIAIYRAPDLGTTGSLPTAQVIAALRAHQVIGVDTKDIREVTVTRLARNLGAKDIQDAVGHAIEHRGGLGDAANLQLAFDRDVQDLHLDAYNTGAMQPIAVHYDSRSTRFDVTFEIGNDSNAAPTRLRFTGSAIETVEAAVLTRNVERTDVLKSSDLMVERRPKLEIGGDAAAREGAVGMQMRRPMRAGQALKVADLAKPDLVQRDQGVTVIYQTAGLYLTTRGKALDSGTEGDVVNVINLQSKRTVTGVVSGRGQVTIQIATPQPVVITDPGLAETPASTAADNHPQVSSSQVPSNQVSSGQVTSRSE